MRPRHGVAGGLTLLLALGAAAQPPPGREELQPAFLEIRINSVPGETALVYLEGGDVWVTPEELSRAGLSGFGGVRRDIGGRQVVSLRSLTRDLSFDVDERALVLEITANPSLLSRRYLDLSQTLRPPGIETATATSAFLNYGGRATTEEDLSGVLEAGVSTREALLAGSVSATREDGAVRGLTALSVDDPRRLVRFVAGDAVTVPDALGGAPVVGGLTLGRELSLDPYLVRAPLPRATAFAGTPSVLEVWVNGALARTQEIAPGTYDLSQLPVTAGTNDVRIVVKDAFGRVQSLEAAHYQGQGLLARGLHDWAWHVGAVRRGFGRESFDYGDPILLGRHRVGVTDRFTAGFRLDLGPNVRQAGLSAAAALPVGEVEVAGAASDEEGELGGAGVLAWRYGSRRLGLGADGTLRSRRYAHSTLRAADDRQLWRAGAFASFPLHRAVSMTLQWSGSRSRDRGTLQRVEARTSIPLARGVSLLLSATTMREGTSDRVTAAFVQLVAAMPGGTVDAGVRADGGTPDGTVGAQRTLQPGTGYGWRARADTAGETVSALVQAQPSFGRYEVGYDRAFDEDSAFLTAAGGLVLMEERFFATRPVDQSFALVQVPGVSGVRVKLENQPAGRTDATGNLLVPGLLPYYGSRLSIVDQDVPVTHRVGKTERLVAAPPRGGAIVRFDVERLRAVEGWLRLSGARGVRIPAFGTLEVDTPRGTLRSPIAEDGAFWLEDVPAGGHAARIYFEGDLCEFSMSIPESSPGVVEIGTLGCAERERR